LNQVTGAPLTTTAEAERPPVDDTADSTADAAPAARPAAGRFRARWRLLEGPSRLVLGFSALLTILTWEMPAFSPTQPAGDNDYGLLIALARHLGLSFGDEISTTYGPLYFLAIPSIIARGEVAVGYLFWFVFVTASLAACFQAFQRRIGTRWSWAAVVLLAVSFSIVPLTSVITAATGYVIVLAFCYASGMLPRWAERAFPIAMGILVAAMLLTKFSVGLTCGPMVLGAVLVREGRRLRGFLEFAISGLVGLVALWIIAGQPPTQVVDYVVRALSVGSGHAQSMGLEGSDNFWEYPVAAVVTIVLLIAVLRTKVPGWRLPLWIGLAACLFLMFKQGFVRHDSHSAQFFSVMLALGVVLAVLRRSAAMAAVAVVALLAQSVSVGGGLYAIDPAKSLKTFADGTSIIVSGGYRDDVQEASRAAIKQRVGLPPQFPGLIGDKSVRVEPFDHTIAWTYGLKPAILPTLLNYGAYTELLDDMNAKWIADDASAPDFLIREDTRITLDGRFPLWDPPRTSLEEACRYEFVDAGGKWQLLKRVANRCGGERELTSMTVAAGQRVEVPQVANGLVVARVYPDQSFVDKVESFLFKPGDLRLTVDEESHRLPWTHADAPLLMAAPGDKALVLGGRELAAGTFSMSAPGRVVFSVVEKN
jgi:hypothetical protein